MLRNTSTLSYKVLHVNSFLASSFILATQNWPLSGLEAPMCRNIKTLFNFDPPVAPEEVRAASLQFVRKITGFHHPSKANEAAFSAAIDEIAHASIRLLHSLETTAPHRNREAEASKSRARAAARFG
jgi:hypothetical protein